MRVFERRAAAFPSPGRPDVSHREIGRLVACEANMQGGKHGQLLNTSWSESVVQMFCFLQHTQKVGNWFHPLIVSVHIKATSLFVFSPHRAFIMPPCTTALGSAASLKLNAEITFSVFTLMCFSFSRQKYEQIAGEVSRHQHRAEPHRKTPQCYLWQAAFTQYISFFLYISCDWFSH